MKKKKLQYVSTLMEFEESVRFYRSISKRDAAHGYFKTPYLFRGQPGNEEIIASLFREDVEYFSGDKNEFEFILRREFENICQWFARANLAGIQFNFDIWPYINRDSMARLDFILGGLHLSKHYAALSLSRHYECKNRLIDFTKDYYAALFFALISSFESIERMFLKLSGQKEVLSKSGRLRFKNWLNKNFATIWVVGADKLQNASILFPDYGNNAFALAQSAVFVLAPTTPDRTEPKKDHMIFSKSMQAYGFTLEKKIPVHYSAVPELLWQLDRKGINHIMFYPSKEAIVKNDKFMNRVSHIRGIINGTR